MPDSQCTKGPMMSKRSPLCSFHLFNCTDTGLPVLRRTFPNLDPCDNVHLFTVPKESEAQIGSGSDKPKQQVFSESARVERLISRKNQITKYFVALVLLLISSKKSPLLRYFFFTFMMQVFFMLPSGSDHPAPEETYSECGTPLTDIEPWHIRSFRPERFGIYGEPAPIIYQTPGNDKGHMISVVDIDKRDIEIQFWVDDVHYSKFPVDLDSTVDCGEHIQLCLDLNFGAGRFHVPPGKHTVKAEIVKREYSLRHPLRHPDHGKRMEHLFGGCNGREGLCGTFSGVRECGVGEFLFCIHHFSYLRDCPPDFCRCPSLFSKTTLFCVVCTLALTHTHPCAMFSHVSRYTKLIQTPLRGLFRFVYGQGFLSSADGRPRSCEGLARGTPRFGRV